MPMIDYLCDACSYRFENFFHSDPPASMPCPHIECVEGEAKRIESYPGEYQPRSAKRFDPIVIWVSDTDPNKVSFPGRADEAVEEGYHKVEITNLSQADYWTRRISQHEIHEMEGLREAHKQYWDDRQRERRANIRAKIGSNPRMQALFKEAQAFVDKKREGKYSKPLDPHAHFQVIAYDSSNREGYRDKETGWKEKRV